MQCIVDAIQTLGVQVEIIPGGCTTTAISKESSFLLLYFLFSLSYSAQIHSRGDDLFCTISILM